MNFEIVGADPEDPGPQGVVARFMLAAVAGDREAVAELLTAESRKAMGDGAPPAEEGVATFGEVVTEGDMFIVPTSTKGEDRAVDMEFVVREEEGTLLVDMIAAMTRAMGMSPDQLVEQMGGAVAETMGGVMEGVADAVGEVMGGVSDDADDEQTEPGIRD